MDTIRRSLLLAPLALTAGGAMAQTPAPDTAKTVAGWPTPSGTIDLWPQGAPGATPATRKVELTVGDATLGFEPREVAELFARLLR